MAADLLDKYGTSILNLTLIPSSGGVYEVIKNDKIIFSKKELNRFPELEEIITLIES
jgi:selenoprotein W-related protein|tara:strand:+ start:3319 stop:3489 length:171 start_codon:yes stop_codon:yes gene_type:complete